MTRWTRGVLLLAAFVVPAAQADTCEKNGCECTGNVMKKCYFRAANKLELDLSGQQLSRLEPQAFSLLSHVTRLYLGNNELTVLQPGVFHGLASLRTLDLNDNRISALDDGAFNGLPKLEVLYMQSNGLSRVRGAFRGLPLLKTLTLSHNKLTVSSLDSAQLMAPLLRSLLLDGNALRSLPSAVFLQRLPHLQHLDLSDNKLGMLRARGLSALTALRELRISNAALHGTITADALAGLTALTTLSLFSNRIDRVQSGAFRGLVALRVLSIGNNALRALHDGTLDGLSSLRTLRANGNRIRRIEDGALQSCTALQQLYLQGNCIDHLDPLSFIGPQALRRLYLQGNNIKSLGSDMLASLRKLQVLDLQHNPMGLTTQLCPRKTSRRILPASRYRFRSRVCVHERRIDCVLTGWEGWTSCSKSCGGGVTSNAPIISVHAAGGGAPCPRPRSQICNPKRCALVSSAKQEARSALGQHDASLSLPSHATHVGLNDSTHSDRAVAAGTGALVLIVLGLKWISRIRTGPDSTSTTTELGGYTYQHGLPDDEGDDGGMRNVIDMMGSEPGTHPRIPSSSIGPELDMAMQVC